MFERYTERARRVLFFARYEASQLGSISIETEHLLLGLIREGKGLTSRIFARSHLSLENIRKEIEVVRFSGKKSPRQWRSHSVPKRNACSSSPPKRQTGCSTTTSAPNISCSAFFAKSVLLRRLSSWRRGCASTRFARTSSPC